MKLRQALVVMGPSLALQRAAAQEIAWLDAELARINAVLPDDLFAGVNEWDHGDTADRVQFLLDWCMSKR